MTYISDILFFFLLFFQCQLCVIRVCVYYFFLFMPFVQYSSHSCDLVQNCRCFDLCLLYCGYMNDHQTRTSIENIYVLWNCQTSDVCLGCVVFEGATHACAVLDSKLTISGYFLLQRWIARWEYKSLACSIVMGIDGDSTGVLETKWAKAHFLYLWSNYIGPMRCVCLFMLKLNNFSNKCYIQKYSRYSFPTTFILQLNPFLNS